MTAARRPSRCRTKKSRRRLAVAVGTAPGAVVGPGKTISSKSLFALMRALTTCIVEAGSTLRSSSPTVSSSLPCELVGVGHVRLRGVVRADRPAHPRLVPPDLVHPVVVAAAVGDGRLVEVAVEQQRPERVLPARRAAVDADARQVDVRVLRGRRLHPEDAVGEAGIGQVLPADVVERLRPPVRPHPVDLHDDEPQLRQRLRPDGTARTPWGRTPPAARRRSARSPDTSLAGRSSSAGRSRRRCRSCRRAPSPTNRSGDRQPVRPQGRLVGPLQLADELAVLGPAKLGDRRQVDARIGVDRGTRRSGE